MRSPYQPRRAGKRARRSLRTVISGFAQDCMAQNCAAMWKKLPFADLSARALLYRTGRGILLERQ
jgi:hypothetical protein